MTVLRTSLFFLHLIFYFPYLRGQQFVLFLLKSLSFLTCFFFFNIVNILLPFKTMLTYLPPTAFSYFVYYAKFIFLPICVFYCCKWLVKGHRSRINQTSKSAFWRRDWSNYGHCRGTTGIDHEIIRKWWIYESHIFLPRKEEVNVEKILTVKDATYAFMKRKFEKIVITLLSSLLTRQTKPSIREFYPRDLCPCFIFSLST